MQQHMEHSLLKFSTKRIVYPFYILTYISYHTFYNLLLYICAFVLEVLVTQQGCVLRRFVLRRFIFTTLVEPDRALPTCGASLSQFKRPFFIQCASSSFPMCIRFFFFYFSAVLLKLIFPPMTSIKKREKNKNSKQLTLHSFLMSSEPRPGPSRK